MNPPGHQVECRPMRWWVGFRDYDEEPFAWWDIFTRPGFRHVAAFREVNGLMICVNGMVNGVENEVKIGMAYDTIKKMMDDGYQVLTVVITPPPHSINRGALLTCASLVAYMMGMDTRAITPYQLYKQLLTQYDAEVLTHE